MMSLGMGARKAKERRLIMRQVVMSTTIAASTSLAELAAFGANVDSRRAGLFVISGLLAGGAAFMAPPIKKNGTKVPEVFDTYVALGLVAIATPTGLAVDILRIGSFLR
jgi:hypothetical protein